MGDERLIGGPAEIVGVMVAGPNRDGLYTLHVSPAVQILEHGCGRGGHHIIRASAEHVRRSWRPPARTAEPVEPATGAAVKVARSRKAAKR